MNKKNTINLNSDVFSRLKKYGQFGETYSELIQRLLDQSESTKEKMELQNVKQV